MTNMKENVVPFQTAEEAYFWALQGQKAKDEGARIVANMGDCLRPCEVTDIFLSIKRLYDKRLIKSDHILTLKFFGIRGVTPDPRICHRKDGRDERKAYKLWKEAMDLLEGELVKKNIIVAPIRSY